MSSYNVVCCLLIRDPLQNNEEPQIHSICSIQEMPKELQEKWSETIVEELLFNNAKQDENFLGLVLNLDDIIEIMNDSDNSDPEIYSAHYRSLAEIIRALEAHQQSENLSTHISAPVNALNNFNRTKSLNLLHQAIMTNTIVGFHAALGALTYRCIRFATSLRILSKSPFLHD